MKKVWFFNIALALVTINWHLPAVSSPQCKSLFYIEANKSEQNEYAAAIPAFFQQFEQIVKLSSWDTKIQDMERLIHTTILKFATTAELKAQVPAFIQSLKKYMAQKSFSEPEVSRHLRKLSNMVRLLELITDDSLDLWKSFLLHHLGTNYGGTGKYLLGTLPESSKQALLRWLGSHYFGQYKRDVPKPIHTLLNPKAMYTQFKKQGLSDRAFYNAYLEKVKRTAFPNNRKVGGYSGDMVIEIAKTVQAYLKTKPDMQAIQFFGSVPNGFGTPKSDLDIFNLPDLSLYPDEVERTRGWMRKMGPSPVDALNYQIDDPVLAKEIRQLTSQTVWSWHLENHGVTTQDNIAAEVHTFSFHITKDKVTLRFYDNPIEVDQEGNPVNFRHYIELDISS